MLSGTLKSLEPGNQRFPGAVCPRNRRGASRLHGTLYITRGGAATPGAWRMRTLALRSLALASLVLLSWGTLGRTQTTYGTLIWDAPTSTPSLPGGERLVYTLYRRGANQTTYQRVRAIPTSSETYQVALPQGVGYICYRVGVLRAPVGGIREIDVSPWAEVQGFPGCLALCLKGAPPYPALASDECAPP